MTFTYPLAGVCSRTVTFDLDDSLTVTNVSFVKGCPGNALGIGKLSSGKNADELIDLLENTTCGEKITSCPDQFAKALIKAKATVKDNSINDIAI